MNTIIITPPLVQLNTPYPSGAYLQDFFKKFYASKNINANVEWADLSNFLFHEIFSKSGLKKLFFLTQKTTLQEIQKYYKNGNDYAAQNIERYLSLQDEWREWIEPIVKILCDGSGESTRELCHKFIFSPHVPRGSRCDKYLENLNHDLTTDDARFLASLSIADLADYITFVADKNFSLIRYAESITVSKKHFSEIEKDLSSFVLNEFYSEVLEKFFSGERLQKIEDAQKTLVCISVPFAGTFEAALFTGKFLKKKFGEKVYIAFGGGFANTELRDTNELGLNKYLDAISLDRGYGSYKELIKNFYACNFEASEFAPLYKLRQFTKDKIIEAAGIDQPKGVEKTANGVHKTKGIEPPAENPKSCGSPENRGTLETQKFENEITSKIFPDYSGIDFSRYPRMIDDTNPMQRLWSDGAWLKAYLAHGCYWHKCAFCDVNLDYVKAYKKTQTKELYASLFKQVAAHKIHGVHFVDEAMPPACLIEFAKENFIHKNALTFWGNIRFEKTFSRDIADFLAYCGLVGVSGGIEIATGSGLDQIHKGTDIDSIVSACCAFKEAGVLIHAYMIYGYFGQTEQDTINSMETLRQLFSMDLIDSCFWHKFVLTRYSRIYSEYLEGKHKDLCPTQSDGSGIFSKNVLNFKGEEKSAAWGRGLNTALEHWMHGEGLNKKVTSWFDFKMPEPTVSKNYIEKSVAKYEARRDAEFVAPINLQKAFWLGGNIIKNENKIFWFYMGQKEEIAFKKNENAAVEDAIKILDALSIKNYDVESVRKIEASKEVLDLLKKFHGKGLVVIKQ